LFSCEDGVGPQFLDFFRVFRGEFRETGAFGGRAVLHGNPVFSNPGRIKHQLEIFCEARCKEIPRFIVAFTGISTNDCSGIGTFPDGTNDQVGRDTPGARDENRAHRGRLLRSNRAGHVSSAVASFPAKELGNTRHKA
jgi:hypothetical protein